MACKDYKVIPRESLTIQHRLVVLNMCIRSRKRWIVNKIRWRDLKGKTTTIFKKKVIEEGDWSIEGETTLM